MSSASAGRLSAAEFQALCKLLWGAERIGWQRASADFLGVAVRNVQFFAAEPPATSKPVPQNLRERLEAEVRRRLSNPDERAAMLSRRDRHARQLVAMDDALGAAR